MKADRSLGSGVYYAPDEYAGFVRRIVAAAIDSAVLLIVALPTSIALEIFFSNSDSEASPEGIGFMAFLLLAWCYLVVLKRSHYGTVAYKLLDIKIVDTSGRRPPLLAMTFRLLMWLFGPFNLILDLIWIGADCEQQTLRDCYAGTYVVRRSAEPLGTAELHLSRYCAWGLTLMYPRVIRPAVVETELA